MVEVRAAAEADVAAIIGLARRMHAESPRYSRLTFDGQKCELILRMLIAGTVPGGALVAESGGTIVGMMIGFVVEHFFGPEKTASDFALYIAPEHRGGRTAVRLVRAFEQAARAAGAVDLTLGISTELNTERTADLYSSLGYRRAGLSMVKELH